MKIISPFLLIAFIAAFLISLTFECEEHKTKEALVAYENCYSASEDTVYRKIREENDKQKPNTLCNILNTLWRDCIPQYLALEKCVGYDKRSNPHYEEMEGRSKRRLFYIRETLTQTYANQNINFSKCEIFNRIPIELTTSQPPTKNSGNKGKQNQ